MTKDYYRKKYLQMRKQMDFKDVNALSERIMKGLQSIDDIDFSKRIYGYMSFNNEVDPFLLMTLLEEQGGIYCAPRIVSKGEMVFSEISGYEDLQKNKYGIYEPKSSASLCNVEKGSIFIVPGACFSEDGYRVGYGGGFYDRYMEKYPECIFIGVAFESQVVEVLPIEGHDQRLNYLVTEERIVKFDNDNKK